MNRAEHAQGSGAGIPDRSPKGLAAAVEAGLLAGFLFLTMEVLLSFLTHTSSPFGPAHLLVVGLSNPSDGIIRFTISNVILGLLIHFVLSVTLTVILARIVRAMSTHIAVAFGFVFGFFLYYLNYYVFALWLPVMIGIREISTMINYVIFGVSGAWIFKLLQRSQSSHEPPEHIATKYA